MNFANVSDYRPKMKPKEKPKPKPKPHYSKAIIPVIDEPLFLNVPAGWTQHYDWLKGYYVLKRRQGKY